MENLIFIPFMWFALEQILYYKVPKYILPYIMILLSVVGVYFGTNTGILSTSAAMSNFAILSCFIAEDGESQYLKKQQNKMQLYLMTVLILLTLLMRLLIVWRDYFRIEDFQYYISSGPLSGTYTTEQVKNNYYNVINDFDSIHLSENDILFCGTHVPVAYLYSDLQYGTMSVAFSSLNYTRLNAYWELHLDKYPTVIYYNKLSYTDEESEFIDKLYADNWEITITENRLIATKIE